MYTRAETLRNLSVDLVKKRILISRIKNSIQENDLKEPANCNGFGRIKHFKRKPNPEWSSDPLPNDPACKALNIPKKDLITAQVFQIAACDWSCWYCFVPNELMNANSKYADWISASELIELYFTQDILPPVIDLSGGSPSIVPEWIPWTINALSFHNEGQNVYLWSDDNLSNDFFWRYLSDEDLELIINYRKYGRVCCFKGYNSESFTFNTGADPIFFINQFKIMKQLLKIGIDLYSYTTFTAPSIKNLRDDMKHFIDMLQELHPNLPLRTIPLEIVEYTPVKKRLDEFRKKALLLQWNVLEEWIREMENRFSAEDFKRDITEIDLNF